MTFFRIISRAVLCVGLSLLLMLGTAACAGKQTAVTEGENETMNETPADNNENATVFSGERSVIDIYLIAGQSNAVGCTKITDRTAAYAFAPELQNGFSNVLISGRARWDSREGYSTRDDAWQPVTLGLGVSDGTYMGPEAGMAKALDL